MDQKKKMNCWEFKKCGREPGGENVSDQGVCPTATEDKADGIHGGENGGRCCWVLAGTLCKGEIQGTYAEKFVNCEKCDFYALVKEEEYPAMRSSILILKEIKEKKH